MPKPNLIVFLTDQQRADTLAAYGNHKIHAPNLNKLAAESFLFERAYVTQPLCTPSRSALFTGMWPHTNGCTRNGLALDPEHLTLAELCQDREYHFAYMGKWQLGNETTCQRGFQTWISTEGVSDYSRLLIDRGYVPDKPNGSFSEVAISNVLLEAGKPAFLEKHACRFLEKHSRDPFVLILSFVEPHSPYNGPLNDEHSLGEVELDATALAPPNNDVPLRYQLMREWQQAEAVLDHERLPLPYFFGATREDYIGIRQRYYGLVTALDRSIGAILGCLESTGLMDNTIVIYTSDHGDMLGAHHLFAKEVMFEGATRVPFFIRMPGQRGAQRIAAAISQIDFLPTALDLLSQAKPAQCAGKSLLPWVRGEMSAAENVFIEWSPNRMKAVKGTRLTGRRAIKRALEESTRTIVSPEGWKLSLRDKDRRELYDLTQDPAETKNLFDDGSHTSVVKRGRDAIHRWQERVNDSLRI